MASTVSKRKPAPKKKKAAPTPVVEVVEVVEVAPPVVVEAPKPVEVPVVYEDSHGGPSLHLLSSLGIAGGVGILAVAFHGLGLTTILFCAALAVLAGICVAD